MLARDLKGYGNAMVDKLMYMLIHIITSSVVYSKWLKHLDTEPNKTNKNSIKVHKVVKPTNIKTLLKRGEGIFFCGCLTPNFHIFGMFPQYYYLWYLMRWTPPPTPPIRISIITQLRICYIAEIWGRLMDV